MPTYEKPKSIDGSNIVLFPHPVTSSYEGSLNRLQNPLTVYSKLCPGGRAELTVQQHANIDTLIRGNKVINVKCAECSSNVIIQL